MSVEFFDAGWLAVRIDLFAKEGVPAIYRSVLARLSTHRSESLESYSKPASEFVSKGQMCTSDGYCTSMG
jgi:hypothetical protein